MGAARVIDYCRDDFVTAAGEYDVILDMVGNKTAPEILSILASRGRYVAVSGPMPNRWLGPLTQLLRTRLAFRKARPSFHQFTAAAATGLAR